MNVPGPRVEVLRQVAILRELNDAALTALAEAATPRAYAAGQNIVTAGAAADSLHVITEGLARVLVKGRPRRDLGRGDSFGEVALIDGDVRSATVYARTSVTTLAIGPEALADVRASHADVDAALLLGFARYLRDLEKDHWAAAEELRLRGLQSTFLANASHELRTPLTVGLGYVQVARRLAEDERLDRALGAAETGLSNLRTIIDDLIGLTAAARREEELTVSMHPLGRIIERAVADLRIDHDRLTIAVPDDLEAELDADRIGRVIAVLVDNAFKFGPEGGTVDITVEVEGGAINVLVWDDGPGVAPDEREALFDLFTQRDGSSTRERGGLGIGLPLARTYARLHGGDVTAREGPPSCFVLTLPRMSPDTAAT